MKKQLELIYNCSIKNGKIYGLEGLRNSIANIEYMDIRVHVKEILELKTLPQIRAFHGTVLDQVQNCHMEQDGEYIGKDKLKHQLKQLFLEQMPLYWSDGTPKIKKVRHPERPNVFFSYQETEVPSLSTLTKDKMVEFTSQIISHYIHERGWSIVVDNNNNTN